MQEEVHNLARENGMGRCRPVNGLGSGQTYLGLSVDPIRIKGRDNIKYGIGLQPCSAGQEIRP